MRSRTVMGLNAGLTIACSLLLTIAGCGERSAMMGVGTGITAYPPAALPLLRLDPASAQFLRESQIRLGRDMNGAAVIVTEPHASPGSPIAAAVLITMDEGKTFDRLGPDLQTLFSSSCVSR